MIAQIKLFLARTKRGFLGKKTYTKKEITHQLEMPIHDTTQLDSVLDTSKISLLNKSRTPLPPLTRFLIEITDNSNNEIKVEKIYRVVDVDKVSNVVLGNKTLYRHTITLVEITKILEREPVDNLTFTNYLHDSTARDVPVEEEISYSGQFDKSKTRYENDTRILGPNHLLGVDDTISTNISLYCWGYYYSDFLCALFDVKTGYKLNLKEFYVLLPDGSKQNLSQNGTFTYSQQGTHTFVQKYQFSTWASIGVSENSSIAYYSWEATAKWKVNSVSAITKTSTYTIGQAINRLLKCHKALINGEDEQKFTLDESLHDKLDRIQAPEFVITQGTLFEGLAQIGNYINAIPRLIPRNVNGDDMSYWDVITFDFLNGTSEFKNKQYSIIDAENPLEEYATNFISNVQNATITNYSGKSAAIEPIKNGFISTRTESANYEISDNECVIKTREKIKAIVRVTALFNGTKRDITQRVVEKSIYNLKSEYNANSHYDMKSSYLYYEEGKNNIYGLNFVSKTALSTQTFGQNEAIKNILGFTGQIKDLAFNIEYIPWVNFKVRQFKPYIDINTEDSSLYYNQQANEVDIDAYGENMHHALTKTGNVKIGKTQYSNTLKGIPKCGQFYLEGNQKYYAFQVNREIGFNCPIKSTTAWAKDYNELYADIAVKKAIRQFEISERECVERNVDIQNFCVIDSSLDLDSYAPTPYDELPQETKESIMRQLWSGFGHQNNLKAITDHLNKTVGITERITTAAICRIKYRNPGENPTTKNILCPATFHSFGRAIVCRFRMDDNFSAGTYIDTTGTGREDVDVGDDSVIERPKGSYAIENYIQYGNKYGRTEFLEFALVDEFKKGNWSAQGAAYYLYDLDDNDYFRLSGGCFNAYVYFGYTDFNAGAIVLDKDSREQISVSCQLNFVTHNSNINIYKAFVDSLPYICDSDVHYKEVVFYNEQNKTDEQIKGGYYTIANNLDATYSQYTATITIPSKEAVRDGRGYGIVTKDNKLCVFIRKDIKAGDIVPPIHLMFRHNI